MTHARGIALYAVVLLAACGSSNESIQTICDNAQTANTTLTAKVAACTDIAMVTAGAFTLSQCESECSTSDESILNGLQSCFSALPTCTKSTEHAFEEAAATCVTPLCQVTDLCQDAIGIPACTTTGADGGP